MIKKITTFILIIIILFSLSSCSAEKYGKDLDKSLNKVKIKDIFINQSLIGQKVIVEGIIITQCQSKGCWFFINDNTGTIFINLAPMGINLPPKTGKRAVVMGKIVTMEGNTIINAEGLEIN
ncbi:MAG: hypothetical protein NZ826_06445 [Thermodesulfovibrio sp.]|nr:hypothetical protein [Thermodesulfovibrio sp.]